MTRHVLIVDDDPVQRRLLESHVTRLGHLPIVTDNGAAAIALLRADGASLALVILDLNMPDVGGLDVLAAKRRLGVDAPVLVLTGTAGIETVVEAMRAGAFDFIVKPVGPKRLEEAIEKALRAKASQRPPAIAAESRADRLAISRSSAMQPVLSMASRAARSTIPLLIEGETGVGKEWLAEAIVAAGPRAKAPFVVLNCAALPAPLFESILFGHEKGSFTDASERQAGKFMEADGGTLFLDEIGELPTDLQVKLLRVLQRGEIDRIGGKTVRTDVRVIAATNRDLAGDVEAQRFRADLYYRLNVLTIRLPPLRERRDEIAGLARKFLQLCVRSESGSSVTGLSQAALEVLVRYDWPGNVRQLENAIHRAVVLATTERLGVDDFSQIIDLMPGGLQAFSAAIEAPTSRSAHPVAPLPSSGSPATLPPSAVITGLSDLPAVIPTASPTTVAAFDADGALRSIEALEADLIRIALGEYPGSLVEVARHLGIGRSTLYRKLREYGISEADAAPSKAGRQ